MEKLCDVDWNKVYEVIIKKNNTLYYVGGTLSVSLDKDKFVALNLSGGGFDQNDNQLTQPSKILSAVRRLYRQEKGITSHYIKTICY